MVTPIIRWCVLPATLLVALIADSVAAQMDWKQLHPTVTPPRLSGHSTAYDAARQRILIFGGVAIKSTLQYSQETWEWDGQTWSQRFSATAPLPRESAALAYDAYRNRIVMFGGWTTLPAPFRKFDDTWEWDGRNWIQSYPATKPPARWHHTMVYDSARRRTVVFGGKDEVATFGDTWEWDGSNWAKRSPTTSPPARSGHGMAYDAARQRTVLYGGIDSSSMSLDDTWEWDGNAWIRRFPPVSPQSGAQPIWYDAARQLVVINSTWEWDGRSWSPYLPPTPPLWFVRAVAYDTARGSAIAYCDMYPLTWRYAPVDLTASNHLVSVVTGANLKLDLDAGAKHASKSYQISGCMDGATQRGIPLGGTMLLLNPDLYFWFNVLYPNVWIKNSLGTLDTSGKATATIHVPPLPTALIGWRFYHAYVVFQSSIDYASTPVPLTLVP